MPDPSRLTARLWLLIPLGAIALLVLLNLQRARRVDAVTRTDAASAIVDASSPTGYAGGKRWLIVPEHNARSYQWIAETQQMLARGEWRVRHIDYENSPFGREVHAASPYRWWLAATAWCDHVISGRPLGLSMERAALGAEPLLHLLLVVGTTLFVARHFGRFAAALAAAALVMVYPFAGGFLPGAPDDRSLARICGLWSVLPLLAAVSSQRSSAADKPHDPLRQRRRLFIVAGIAGGIGLWINAGLETLVLAGIGLGAIVAMWLRNRRQNKNPALTEGILPWRWWGLTGAVTCLAAYLIEYFPSHLNFRLEVNHPLYGLAWLGLGELLQLIDGRLKQSNAPSRIPTTISLTVAVIAFASLPVAMKLSGASPFFVELADSRLTSLPNGVVARNLAAWATRDGLSGALIATCLPLLFLGFALLILVRRQIDASRRHGIVLALGPVLIVLVLACSRIAWWHALDALLLVLAVAISAALTGRMRWVLGSIAGAGFLAGLLQLLPPAVKSGKIEFTKSEVEGLVERELAHWVADRVSSYDAVIFAPPSRTASWGFHGGLRGLGTANWENRAGLEATVRIATATTADEARALIDERGITHLVLPSWDSDLSEFARWQHQNANDAFVMALQHWALPPWLRPLPYRLPAIASFEKQSVAIFAVTDESNRPAALSRLAEYFIEASQLELAAASRENLQRYPTDLAALVAIARIEKARGDASAFTPAFSAVLSSINAGFDRTLAWDRRVSLAVVLALGGKADLAREQTRRCLAQITEARIRSLTTGALYQLLVLGKTYELPMPNPAQRELALRLLPPEVRSRL